jgi:hypothetical protein
VSDNVYPLHRRRTGGQGVDDGVRACYFKGSTEVEVFAKALDWLRANEGHVAILDLGWSLLPDDPEALDLAIYFYPE